MYDHISERRVDSSIVPGVVYSIHAPSYARRAAFDAQTAEFRASTRLLNKRWTKVQAEIAEQERQFDREHAKEIAAATEKRRRLEAAYDEATDAEERSQITKDIAAVAFPQFQPGEDFTEQIDELNQESLRLLTAKYNQPRILVYLKSIDGLSLNGKSATPKTLLEDGPPELFREVLSAIDEIATTTADTIKNLSLPSISNSRVAGKTTDTTAPSASGSDSTAAETAGSISPTA